MVSASIAAGTSQRAVGGASSLTLHRVVSLLLVAALLLQLTLLTQHPVSQAQFYTRHRGSGRFHRKGRAGDAADTSEYLQRMLPGSGSALDGVVSGDQLYPSMDEIEPHLFREIMMSLLDRTGKHDVKPSEGVESQ